MHGPGWRATGRALLLAALTAGPLLAASLPARAAQLYTIDQRFGKIGFTVRHLGLFSSQGDFSRFGGELTIDPAHPEQTRVTVQVDAASVEVPWQDGTALLRSPPYFDVVHFPVVRFTSTDIVVIDAARYQVRGTLELRGISRPLVLEASLLDRHPDPASGGDVADFVVHGTLDRSDFGMTADRVFISDRVELRINARIRIDAAPHAG